jgi:DnaJ-class molecular chaperone
MHRQDRSPLGHGTANLNPGDEAEPGTVGAGEAICPKCHGIGKAGGVECPNCGGTGRVVEGIGGG